jgi:hypothetical protein
MLNVSLLFFMKLIILGKYIDFLNPFKIINNSFFVI